MKKVLALVLAVVLAFGMTTVAFAAAKPGKASDLVFGTTKGASTVSLYTYDDAGKGTMNVVGSELKANTTYYFDITDHGNLILDSGNKSTPIISKLVSLSEYRIKTKIDDGAGYIAELPSFVIKKVDGKNQAYVTFKTADKFNKEAVSVDMTISAFSNQKDYAPQDYDRTSEASVSIIGDISYDKTEVTTYTVVVGPLASFEKVDGECELEFDDNILFKVNGKGQKDLFLRMNDEDEALTNKYPDANLKIVKFEGNNRTFRSTGTLTIPADMVENKDGKMVAPILYNYEGVNVTVNKNATYNEDLAAFQLKTNTLGSYVITDSALKESSTSTDKNNAVEQNPNTGANDIVGLVVALAAVSVAGIAVAKRK